MVNNNITSLLLIIFMCVIIHKTYSFENDEQETSDDMILDPHMINSPSSIDIDNLRRSESAERYFDWIKKTQRPVEYLRGKRFWLFAKKEDDGVNMDLPPNTKVQQNSLTQGLWRSGIVGRRRRR